MLVSVCSQSEDQAEGHGNHDWLKSQSGSPTEDQVENYSQSHSECLQVSPFDFSQKTLVTLECDSVIMLISNNNQAEGQQDDHVKSCSKSCSGRPKEDLLENYKEYPRSGLSQFCPGIPPDFFPKDHGKIFEGSFLIEPKEGTEVEKFSNIKDGLKGSYNCPPVYTRRSLPDSLVEIPHDSLPECDQDRLQKGPLESLSERNQEGIFSGDDALDSLPESHHSCLSKDNRIDTASVPEANKDTNSPRSFEVPVHASIQNPTQVVVDAGSPVTNDPSPPSPPWVAEDENSLVTEDLNLPSPSKVAEDVDLSPPSPSKAAEDANPPSSTETAEDASPLVEALPYRCTECGGLFDLADALLAHLWAHIEASQGFECAACGLVLRSRAARRAHEALHTASAVEPLRCSLCPVVFRFEKSLQAHVLRTHAKQEVMSCTVCRAEFTSAGALRKHVWQHVADSDEDVEAAEPRPKVAKMDPFLAAQPLPLLVVSKKELAPLEEKIGTKLADLLSLGLEKVAHDDLGMASDELEAAEPRQPVQLSMVDAAKAEVTDRGVPKTDFRCSTCSRTFPKRHLLSSHYMKHIREQIPNLGGKSLGQKTSRKDPTTRVKASAKISKGAASAGSFICDICPRNYKTKTGLYYHQKVHRRNDGEFFCHLCEEVQESKQGLTYHLSTSHPWDFVRTGSVPGGRVASARPSKTPPLFAVLAEPIDSKPHCCPVCPRTFPKRNHLANHIKSHSRKANAGGSPAATVGLAAPSPPAGKEPLVSAAAGSPSCPSPTKTEGSPGRSVGSPGRTGQLKVCCRICKKKFDAMRGLHIHMVRVHKMKLLETMKAPKPRKKIVKTWNEEKSRELRPFACPHCPWRFKSMSHLMDHKQSKHENNVYSCDLCPASFRIKRLLRRHLIEAHNTGSRAS